MHILWNFTWELCNTTVLTTTTTREDEDAGQYKHNYQGDDGNQCPFQLTLRQPYTCNSPPRSIPRSKNRCGPCLMAYMHSPDNRGVCSVGDESEEVWGGPFVPPAALLVEVIVVFLIHQTDSVMSVATRGRRRSSSSGCRFV